MVKDFDISSLSIVLTQATFKPFTVDFDLRVNMKLLHVQKMLPATFPLEQFNKPVNNLKLVGIYPTK